MIQFAFKFYTQIYVHSKNKPEQSKWEQRLADCFARNPDVRSTRSPFLLRSVITSVSFTSLLLHLFACPCLLVFAFSVLKCFLGSPMVLIFLVCRQEEPKIVTCSLSTHAHAKVVHCLLRSRIILSRSSRSLVVRFNRT